MAAEQRRLLQQLMGGTDTGLAAPERIDLYDPRICRGFLVDTCVHDLFGNTKHDIGRCRRMHSEAHRMAYMAQKKDNARLTAEFEDEYEAELERYVAESNRRIEQANQRLKKSPEDFARIHEATLALENVNNDISLSWKEVEVLGRHGHIQKAIYELRRVQGRKPELEAKTIAVKRIADTSGHQKLQTCDVCGAYLSRIDSDKRLADHFLGKMHVGYVQLRKLYETYRTKNERRRREGSKRKL